MDHVNRGKHIPQWIGLAFLACLVGAGYAAIAALNDGMLVYTLDDPYIHLALAENLRNGHYGVNAGEFSAPSSSILWPFLLAPFASSAHSAFVLNGLAAIASVVLLAAIAHASAPAWSRRAAGVALLSVVVVLAILATNVVGLVFTGMEHSLQLAVVLLVARGLIVVIERDTVPWWLVLAIVVAPLVRYECLAVSVPAIGFLCARRHVRPALLALLAVVLLVGGFSVFLVSLGLEAFPSSVTAKSSVVQSGGSIARVVANLERSLTNRQGVVMAFGLLPLLAVVLRGTEPARRQLAATTVVAVLMHFVAGSYGWYNRYEIYLVAFELAVSMYLFLPWLAMTGAGPDTPRGLAASTGLAVAVAACAATPYVVDLASIPNASNNIYQQQYQMHRFVVEHYRQPVAVNDLGYVSYRNPQYVLDLWGLGSQKALRARLNPVDPDWRRHLVDAAGVRLVMVYDEWFGQVPAQWIKLGALQLGRRKVTAAFPSVSFYATDAETHARVKDQLVPFVATLPPGVSFKPADEPIATP